MIRVLLNTYRVNEPWCYSVLASYIRPSDRIFKK